MLPGPQTQAMSKKETSACANSGCANIGTKKCGSCQSISYCSRECQKADWKAHKDLCKRFSEAVKQATSAIKDATAAALTDMPKTEATDETGPFVFAYSAEEEWAARKVYLDEKINKCELSEERLDRLKRVLAAADAEDNALNKLVRLKSFIDVGKSAKSFAAAYSEKKKEEKEEGAEEGVEEEGAEGGSAELCGDTV
jgi:hypothetical protein